MTSRRAAAAQQANASAAPATLAALWPGGVSTPDPQRKQTEYRLPGALVPWHYDVELQPFIYAPNPASFKFRGNVSIHFRVLAADQRNITLHSLVNISLESVVLRCLSCAARSQPPPALRAIALVNELAANMVAIMLNDKLELNENYSLWASFSGPLLRDMHGLYWSSYKVAGPNGSETRCV